jgi:hypothetical protein
MKSKRDIPEKSHLSAHQTSALRLTTNHGYRFEGDWVTLNAELTLRTGARIDGWSLEQPGH